MEEEVEIHVRGLSICSQVIEPSGEGVGDGYLSTGLWFIEGSSLAEGRGYCDVGEQLLCIALDWIGLGCYLG